MSYTYSSLGYSILPSFIDAQAVADKVESEQAAKMGLTLEQYRQRQADRAATQPKAVCSPVGHLGWDMLGNLSLCLGGSMVKVGTRADRFNFGGRTNTTPAHEFKRVGVPLEQIPELAKKSPPPHKMSGLKNLGDPYAEYAFQQLSLLPELAAAGVPQSLLKEVSDKYKERVKSLNAFGGTRKGITTSQSAAMGGPAMGLKILEWYNQPIKKRIADMAVKYKKKITKVTAAEEQAAAESEYIDQQVSAAKKKKLLIYGGTGIAAIAIGFLLT